MGTSFEDITLKICIMNLRTPNLKLIMLICSFFFLYNCEDEIIDNENIIDTESSIEPEENNSDEPNIQVINRNELMLNEIVINQLEKISHDENSTAAQRGGNNESFTVNKDYVKYIEYGDYHSYSFQVLKDEANDYLENLVFSLNDEGNYDITLITYELTELELARFLTGREVDLTDKLITRTLDIETTSITYARPTSGPYCYSVMVSYCAEGNHVGGFESDGSFCPAHVKESTYYCTWSAGGSSSGGGGETRNGETGGYGGGNTNNNNENYDPYYYLTPNCGANDCPSIYEQEIMECFLSPEVSGTGSGFSPYNWLNDPNTSDFEIKEIAKYLEDNNCSSNALEKVEAFIEDDWDNYYANNPREFIFEYDFENNKVVDVTKMMNCFIEVLNSDPAIASRAKFKITVHVEQPNPGTRDTYKNTWYGPNPGHTFVTMEMNDPISSTSISQSIGFYPSESVNPFSSNPSIAGEWVDNGNYISNISISEEVDLDEFKSIINFVNSTSNSQYNLNTFNCTDMAIQIAARGGLNLPDTTGSWGIGGVTAGSGTNPGDLGEDIRALSSSNPNVNRSSQASPTSKGECH